MRINVCAECHADFSLNLYACKEMIPYFLADGHWDYATDSIVHLRMSVSVFLFSSFKKINLSLAKLYKDVFTDDNISINKSIVSSHHSVTSSLIALHALCGYHSVPMMFGLGKWKTLKTVSKIPLRYFRDINANLKDAMREGTFSTISLEWNNG